MKNLVNKINEIGNQALFAANAEQVEKAAKAFKEVMLEGVNEYGDAKFTEEGQNICADALTKVRLAVGAKYSSTAWNRSALSIRRVIVGVDDDACIYSVDEETTVIVDGEPVHADGIALTLTPSMIAFFLYNLFTDSAAEIIAATGEQIDLRRKVWQMVSVMVFTDATGPAFTEDAIKLVKDHLDMTAERLHAANGDINQIKHTVH
ncbi:hypothetical protein ACLB1T_02790 [Escherichia coli]